MITRSAGLPVTVASIPFLVGSGYEGLTKELDDTVKREAELLTTTFNRDVEIRFNSDRESGGAWLKNSLKGFAGNCQVGLGAGIRAIKPEGMSREDWVHNATREFRKSQPKELYIDTYVSASGLKDPSLAKDRLDDSHYCFLHHKTVDEALAWLIENVDTNKILD